MGSPLGILRTTPLGYLRRFSRGSSTVPEMTPDGSRWYQMGPDDYQVVQDGPSVSRWPQMAQMSPDRPRWPRCHQTDPDGHKWLQITPLTPDVPRLSQRIPQGSPKYSQRLPKVVKAFLGRSPMDPQDSFRRFQGLLRESEREFPGIHAGFLKDL